MSAARFQGTDTAELVLDELHENGRATAEDVSAATGIPPKVVNTCLLRLRGEGLVAVVDEERPVGGLGRPRLVYDMARTRRVAA